MFMPLCISPQSHFHQSCTASSSMSIYQLLGGSWLARSLSIQLEMSISLSILIYLESLYKSRSIFLSLCVSPRLNYAAASICIQSYLCLSAFLCHRDSLFFPPQRDAFILLFLFFCLPLSSLSFFLSLQAIPGLKIVACSTPYNARGLLKSAIRENNPVVFFEHVLTYNLKQEIPLLPYTLPLDKAELAREGKDLTILCYGKLRHVALDGAEQLAKLGIDAEVVDLISLKPLDMDSIKASIKKTGRCVILDESSRTGGIGGEIFTQVSREKKTK